jgi:hypothetical protein
MVPDRDPYVAIRAALDAAEDAATAAADPAAALPHLRTAADHLTELVDDTMARAVVAGGASLRSAAAGVGLSENAVGPRLARTRLLAAYANDSGRVTAAGVERARYDQETGRIPQPADPAVSAAPMRFVRRRTAPKETP